MPTQAWACWGVQGQNSAPTNLATPQRTRYVSVFSSATIEGRYPFQRRLTAVLDFGRCQLADQLGDNISVLKNLGEGTFAEDVTYWVESSPFSVVIGGSDSVAVLLNDGDGTFARICPTT